jgi:hypothetical protein
VERSVVTLASAAIAAVTAAATLVVVPGSIAFYYRLKDANLPADLGVVVSLPTQFLVAIGLTYVLFPLLVIVTAAVVVALVPGDEGKTNSVLRKPFGWSDGWKKDVWSTVAVLAFLILGTAVLAGAVDLSPPWWLVLLALGSVVLCLVGNIPIADKWQDKPDALAAVVLSALVAGLIFTPWAVWFAVVRADFPQATICTTQGERFEGPFVGETSDRVYVGEPAVRIVAVVPPQTVTVLQAKLPVDRYGLRFVPGLTKRRVRAADLALVNLDLVSPGKEAPTGVPVLGFFHKSSPEKRRRAFDSGIDQVLRQAKLEESPTRWISDLLARREVPTARRLKIASIPSSQVSRIIIGGRGSCPAPVARPTES